MLEVTRTTLLVLSLVCGVACVGAADDPRSGPPSSGRGGGGGADHGTGGGRNGDGSGGAGAGTGGSIGSGGSGSGGAATGNGGSNAATGGATGSGGTDGSGGATTTDGVIDGRGGAHGGAGGTAPTFTMIYNAVITPHCGGSQCHLKPPTPAGLNFSTKASAYKAWSANVMPYDGEQSQMFTVLNYGYMPLNMPTLSVEQMFMVLDWIDAGAKND